MRISVVDREARIRDPAALRVRRVRGMDRLGAPRLRPRVQRGERGPEPGRLELPRPGGGHEDDEVIDLGEHKLRFLETPHVHHWDSMMLFEEKTKSLFPSDLFIQPGDQPPS